MKEIIQGFYQKKHFWTRLILVIAAAILMAFAMMLNDLGMTDKAARLNAAILAQVAEGKAVTADIGGTATTTEFTDAVAARL